MKELLISQDFARYRKKQVEEVVNFIKAHIWSKNLDPSYLKGAIEMGRKLIRLPENLVKDKEYELQLGRNIQEDLNQLVVEMTRENDNV